MPKIEAGMERDVIVPDGRSDIMIFDDSLPAFFLRVGRRKSTYGCDFYVAGKRRRLSLGPADGTSATLAAARKQARQILAGAKVGQDPIAKRAEATKAGNETFGRLVRAFLADQESRISSRTRAEWERYLTTYLKPLHSLPIGDLTKREASDELARLARERTPTVSDRALTAAVAAFSWAVRTGRLQANPLLALHRRAEKIERERMLDDGELVEVWRHAGEPGEDFADIVRLLILLPCRRVEVGSLKWDQVDAEKRLLRLVVKGGKTFQLPISPQALAIIEARPRWAGRGHIFGASSEDTGFSGWSRSMARLRGRIARARQNEKRGQIEHWQLHDMRRSIASGMAAIGVAETVADRCLGHVPATSGTARIYQRHNFEKEMRAALTLWGAHVKNLLGK
jgi:integrase